MLRSNLDRTASPPQGLQKGITCHLWKQGCVWGSNERIGLKCVTEPLNPKIISVI